MTEIVTLQKAAAPLRFTWLLPGWFAVGAALGSIWPGHGEQLFCLGSLPGIWACFLVEGGRSAAALLLPTLLGGAPILLLLGWLLDRMRADVVVFAVTALLAAAVAGYVLLQGYADVEHAIDHHGSFAAFAVCALQLGSYVGVLVTFAIEAGRGGRR
jgi:hypothetical protein